MDNEHLDSLITLAIEHNPRAQLLRHGCRLFSNAPTKLVPSASFRVKEECPGRDLCRSSGTVLLSRSGRAEASGAHRHSSFTSPYPSNFAFMSIVAFSSLEIGQPVFAACVAFSHAA